MNWTPAKVEWLRSLRAEGLTFAAAAERMGVTRGAASSAARRLIYLVPDLRGNRSIRTSPKIPHNPQRWTERALTETYAERKLRLAEGRAA